MRVKERALSSTYIKKRNYYHSFRVANTQQWNDFVWRSYLYNTIRVFSLRNVFKQALWKFTLSNPDTSKHFCCNLRLPITNIL